MLHFKSRSSYQSYPSTPINAANVWSPVAWSPASKRNRLGFTSRRIAILISGLLVYFLLHILLSSFGSNQVSVSKFHTASIETDRWSQPLHSRYAINDSSRNVTSVPGAAFQPPEQVQYRYPDTVDTFANYKYRNTCNISSLDLHSPFAPLCPDRKSMIEAMSSGGRIGNDAPYMPRGCDMRWFTTEEICEILGRFEKVIIVGDSMMRHVIGSINVLLRKDLGYGAVTDWNFTPEER